jgi:hypothetical protein
MSWAKPPFSSELINMTKIRTVIPANAIPEARVEQPVEHTVIYSQPQPVMAQPTYVQQSVPVAATQPVFYQQPVVYQQQKPNVVIVKEEKKGIDSDDCCTAMMTACACAWILSILSGR